MRRQLERDDDELVMMLKQRVCCAEANVLDTMFRNHRDQVEVIMTRDIRNAFLLRILHAKVQNFL